MLALSWSPDNRCLCPARQASCAGSSTGILDTLCAIFHGSSVPYLLCHACINQRYKVLSGTVALCSKQYHFNPDLPEERRRMVLTIVPVDWAAEWLRPVSPNYKLVGPILSGPGTPLPAHLEVRHNAAA